MLRIVIVVVKMSELMLIIIVRSNDENRILLVNLGQDFDFFGLSKAWDFGR